MKKQIFKRTLIIFLILSMAVLLSPLLIFLGTRGKIYSNIKEVPSAYTCLVPGALVYKSGNPSGILLDRLDMALKLYRKGKVERFLLSGDHGSKNYDEVNSMHKYLTKEGVPSADIFLDHAGFNTYNSVVRAKKVFQVDTMIVATQEYHLPRAVFLGNAAGIHTTGMVSDKRNYTGIKRFKRREYLALIKAVFEFLIKPNPKYLGDEIPITGDSKDSHG